MNNRQPQPKQFIIAGTESINNINEYYQTDLINPSVLNLKFVEDLVIQPNLNNYTIINMGIKARLFDPLEYNSIVSRRELDRFNQSSCPFMMVPNFGIYDTPLELVSPIIFSNKYLDDVKLAVKNFSDEEFIIRKNTFIASLVPDDLMPTTLKISSIDDHIFRTSEDEDEINIINENMLNLLI